MQRRRYNILFLSSWYPSRVYKYYGDFVKRHAKAVSLYANVICLHVIRDKSMNKRCQRVENVEGSLKEVIYYFNYSRLIKLRYIFYYLKGFRYISKKYSKPDLIHSNVLYPIGIVTIILSFLFKRHFVFTEHWTGFQKGTYASFPQLRKKIYNYVGKKAKFILPVTEDLKQSMIQSGIKANYKVVPNVVNLKLFSREDNVNNNRSKKQILHISHLRDEHKNISGLLRVVSKLGKIRQDFILNIIHSEENKAMFELSDQLNLTDKIVNFCGDKKYSEVANYMNNSAFLVLFSNYENLPCVIVEAFASGLPIISTDVGGIKEHLDRSKGVLVEKGDEKDLLEKMNYMLDHYNDYDKSEMKSYAESKFSYKAVGSEYLDIYNEILDV